MARSEGHSQIRRATGTVQRVRWRPPSPAFPQARATPTSGGSGCVQPVRPRPDARVTPGNPQIRKAEDPEMATTISDTTMTSDQTRHRAE